MQAELQACHLRQYYSDHDSHALLAREDVLAVISFAGRTQLAAPGLIETGLASLNESKPLKEVWLAPEGGVRRGSSGGCHWSACGGLMLAAVLLDEQDCRRIEIAAREAYGELVHCLRQRGFPHPVRFWNYLPAINDGGGDHEFYKRFCTARQQAFARLGIPASAFPAASALGHHGGGALIYGLGAKIPGRHFENPLQQSAYRYPRQYGPSSPSFSRATGLAVGGARQLFVSGTASVIGHQSHAPDDFMTQLQTTCDNLDQLLSHVGGDYPPLKLLKVYLRSHWAADECRRYLSRRYPAVHCLYTEADICRVELQVEIEAICA